MSTTNVTRFFDTSGCLNLSRPSSSTRNATANKQFKRPVSASSGQIRGQVKIDLYNFDHIDFADSKYVLTSPRSLEACARLNIKPATLLPRKLADLTTDKVRYSTLVDVHDEMEMDRIAKLQRCREEREKIIRENELEKSSPTKIINSTKNRYTGSSNIINRTASQRASSQTKFNPSTNALLNKPRPSTATQNNHLPPRSASSARPTVANSILKSSISHFPSSNDQNDLRTSSSASFLDDVRRMDKTLQRLGTTTSNKNDHYVNGLENVKHIIQHHVTQKIPENDLENLAFEKKQYELLLSHYDHELKIQKARENAHRTEKEKENERYETMMHDFLDQTMAEERRQNELRRRLDKLHQSRQLYDALQAKNHEIQMADVQKRRAELLNEIKRKDRRTEHFIKDKQDTVNLSRTIAKSSQDTRVYRRETKENFDQKAKRAELTSSLLITKPKTTINRRHLQTTIQT